MDSKFKIEIPKWNKKNHRGSETIFFQLIVSKGNDTWTLDKRFSECHLLYEDLKKYHGNNLPPFPSKSLFSLKTYEQLNPRRQKLEFFFQNILKRMDLIRDQNVLQFLKLEVSQEDGFFNVVKMIAKMSCTFGVRDFIFDISKVN